MKTRTRAGGSPGAAFDLWDCWSNLAALWWSRHAGSAPRAYEQGKLDALVAFAREASPFYRRLYAHLPHGPVALRELPAVGKSQLMKRFGDWATDRRVSRSAVVRFLSDRASVGEEFLGCYHVWKSSGTSGTPGIFVQDRNAMSVYEALVLAQIDLRSLDARGSVRLLRGAGRSALIAATGDHFASVTAWEHTARVHPGVSQRVFSVLEPTERLVAQLNEYQPSFVASYPSVLRMLAAEQACGRLAISPGLVWSGGEFLGERARAAIEEAFGCRVQNEYGASECLCIASGCSQGWLHVNSEWVIVEGVDANGDPVAPGQLSHTTLITNLANRVQPIIRYDLGDRIIVSPSPCACGDARPAIRVEGRNDAMLEFAGRRGKRVLLPPLAIGTVVEEAAGEHRFQVVLAAPRLLKVRFDAQGLGQRERIGKRACAALRDYLASQSLEGVRVEVDPRAPSIDKRSGKLHAVIVELGRGQLR